MSELSETINKIELKQMNIEMFIENEEDGIKSVSDLFDLLSDGYSIPRDYHLIYLMITKKVNPFIHYSKTLINPMQLYEKVQFQMKVLIRVYEMICVAKGIIQNKPEYQEELLEDLLEFSKCIYSPVKSLFIHHFMLDLISICEKKTDRSLYRFIITNTLEATKAVLRHDNSHRNKVEDIIEMCYPLKEVYEALISCQLISSESLLTEIIPLLLGEIVGASHDFSKPIVLSALMDSLPPTLLLEGLSSFVSSIQQLENDSAFSRLGELIKILTRTSVSASDFILLVKVIARYCEFIETDVFISLLQSLYQVARVSQSPLKFTLEVFSLISPIPTPLNSTSTTNLWNLLRQPIDSIELKHFIKNENFRIAVKKLPEDRVVPVAKKILENYSTKFIVESEEEMNNMLEVCGSLFNSTSEDAEKGLRMIHITSLKDPQIFKNIFNNLAEQAIGIKWQNDKSRLNWCIPPLVFALLKAGRIQESLRDFSSDLIIKYCDILKGIDAGKTVRIGSQAAVTLAEWKSMKYKDLLVICWEAYGDISNSIEQEKSLLAMIGIVNIINVGITEAIDLRTSVELKAIGLLKTVQKCELSCKCASLAGCTSKIRDDKHVFELLKNTAKMGSNVIQSIENIHLFVLILNYFMIHFTTNKEIPVELISKLILLIKNVIIQETDPQTYAFFMNTLLEIKIRKEFNPQYQQIQC
ncbi:vacuolar protein sorting protein 35-2, putative [Entamoeba histolytica HM-3:IMSS]|uniref:Vacuolar protein sorting protein, putative n=2 Tax=Entamoeba histolytica TaxID=5759 RepID=M2RDK1_ENTHI|nr:vacuolar protein sorting protein, putative [Entamoeba histolytica KU27]EMS11775.1 vacuolar protein sorting protein 35-2, putative [Entamoeba histolytica HM-3:IMSS]